MTLKKWRHAGELAPLFERLHDLDPKTLHEEKPLVHFNQEQLIASVEKDVNALLNTRCPLPLEAYLFAVADDIPAPYPTLFGLSDFSFYDGANHQSWNTVVQHIKTAITLYEPRIKSVHVSVHNFDADQQTLDIQVSAQLIIGEVVTSIIFPVRIDQFSINKAS